jgi:hypothetical protein
MDRPGRVWRNAPPAGGEFFSVKIGGGWLLDSDPRSGLSKNLKKEQPSNHEEDYKGLSPKTRQHHSQLYGYIP